MKLKFLKITSTIAFLNLTNILTAAPSTEITEAKLIGNNCELVSLESGDGEPTKAVMQGLSAEADVEHPVQHKKCLLSLQLKVPEGFRVGIVSGKARLKSKLAAGGTTKASIKARYIGHPLASTDERNFSNPGEQEDSLGGEVIIWSNCDVREPALKIGMTLSAMVENTEGAAASIQSETLALPAFIYKKCPTSQEAGL